MDNNDSIPFNIEYREISGINPIYFFIQYSIFSFLKCERRDFAFFLDLFNVRNLKIIKYAF